MFFFIFRRTFTLLLFLLLIDFLLYSLEEVLAKLKGLNSMVSVLAKIRLYSNNNKTLNKSLQLFVKLNRFLNIKILSSNVAYI